MFLERRSHGVGFYDFAKDEESRQEQMKALSDLRDKVPVDLTFNRRKEAISESSTGSCHVTFTHSMPSFHSPILSQSCSDLLLFPTHSKTDENFHRTQIVSPSYHFYNVADA